MYKCAFQIQVLHLFHDMGLSMISKSLWNVLYCLSEVSDHRKKFTGGKNLYSSRHSQYSQFHKVPFFYYHGDVHLMVSGTLRWEELPARAIGPLAATDSYLDLTRT
jgi:hypothetical protein